MRRHLDKIKEIAPDSLEEYEEDEVTRRAIERLLHISIEAVIDISYLFVKELRLGLPTSEESYFDKLSGKVLTPQMVEKLQEMRRFRNVMVHRYDKVDDIRVYYIVWNRLGDLYEFKEEVPRVFEERRFLTGYLVGGVGSKTALVGGGDGYFHPALLGGVYVGWRGMYV